jgi:hypothetical protein
MNNIHITLNIIHDLENIATALMITFMISAFLIATYATPYLPYAFTPFTLSIALFAATKLMRRHYHLEAEATP